MRLSQATLGDLPDAILRPGYDRCAVRSGVVHLGIGAFHRAHQAAVFEAALESGDPRWGITGVSLRSAGVRDQLAPQDGFYTLVTREGDSEQACIIGAVGTLIVAPEDPAAVVAALALPDTHIVTLTVTEKGYHLDPATGALRTGDVDVAADMSCLSAPRTAPGFLVAGLARRRAAGLAPFTAISCDNVPHNGERLRAAVLAIAEAHDRDLARWIATQGAFPQTMVDRIVPATTPDDVARLATLLGVEDRGMVKTEPFLQWVIEDHFAGPRPDFTALGVQLTPRVEPWETAKLRMLNGAHSGIAYLGGLAGIETVDRFVALPAGRRFVKALWDEAETTLIVPPGLDIAAYREELMARFANAALAHRTRQIAIDGSQKLPQRLLATIAARRAAGQGFDRLALAVAAWMRWQSGVDESGAAFVVDDPLAQRTAAALAGASDAAARVRRLLAITEIFPPEMAGDPVVANALTRQLTGLESHGRGWWDIVAETA
ncbi:mannitol dehydrogenase family protein [Sphingosinithalassobacter portus]|uniref:mannitol dehydrogenase family protein n=1 Tax=Stakelama portus TaxID=2676234 RepID=UPI000D6DDD1C|nr:mannitol dehydrogenase family protein [Sphingosinithalassobacter portus]